MLCIQLLFSNKKYYVLILVIVSDSEVMSLDSEKIEVIQFRQNLNNNIKLPKTNLKEKLVLGHMIDILSLQVSAIYFFKYELKNKC